MLTCTFSVRIRYKGSFSMTSLIWSTMTYSNRYVESKTHTLSLPLRHVFTQTTDENKTFSLDCQTVITLVYPGLHLRMLWYTGTIATKLCMHDYTQPCQIPFRNPLPLITLYKPHKGVGIPGRVSAVLYKIEKYCDFLFAILHTKARLELCLL